MASGARLVADIVKRNIKKIRDGLAKEVGSALYQEATVELKEIKKRTPVDLGPLRASEHIEGPLRRGAYGRIIYVRIVAGGPAAPYALFVHEDLEAFHKVGQAKFIESVLLESASFMAARVANRIELNRVLAE